MFQVHLAMIACKDQVSIVSHPQVLARETVKEVPHPDLGTLRAIDWPYKFSETPTRIRSVPPELGAHTEEVLTEILGFGESELAELKEQKLFG